MANSKLFKHGNTFKGTKEVGKKKKVMTYNEFTKLSDDDAKKYFSKVAKASDKQRKKMKNEPESNQAISHYESKMEKTGLTDNWNKDLNVDRNILNERYKIMEAYQNSKSYTKEGVKQIRTNVFEGTKKGIINALGLDDEEIENIDEKVRAVMDYYKAIEEYKQYLGLYLSSQIISMETEVLSEITNVINTITFEDGRFYPETEEQEKILRKLFNKNRIGRKKE